MGTFRCERCGHRDGYDESEGEEDDDDEDDDDGGW
jgi:rubredoxin